MDCVITAGGLPRPDDPLYAYTQGKSKALLDMNGRTMLERVVDALQTAKSIQDIIIVGLGSDMGMTFKRPVHHLPDQGSLVGNAMAGINWLRQRKPDTDTILFCSSDIPTITGPIVDDYIAHCHPYDKALYYIFITKDVMEARFPGSKRTYTKLKGVQIAGGDMILAHATIADGNLELWEKLSNARKHAWQIARAVGWKVLFKLLTRQLSILDIEATAERLIKRPAKIVLYDRAEIGMDADKPHQVDLLREDLKRREGNE